MTTVSLPTMVPAVFLQQVTDAELARYAQLIYDRTGISVSPRKKTLLSNRLRRRLRETGISSFERYFEHLTRLRPDDPEWDAFLQEITTHETYLFRDQRQWEWFRDEYLPARHADARAGRCPYALRIWSAACSTGDEPYTIACCVAAAFTDLHPWKVQILGTDIGVGALSQARKGQFGERAMQNVPDDYRRRFFTRAPGANVWQAKPVLSAMLSFRPHNLLNCVKETPFDLVFLKNVLIYFDLASKRRVMENVKTVLRPGGLLVAGASEMVSDLVRDFVRRQPWLFEKAM